MENGQRASKAWSLHPRFSILDSRFLISLVASFFYLTAAPAQRAAQSLMDLKAEPLIPGQLSKDHINHSELDSEEEIKPPPQFWLRGEYLLWWIKDSKIPALLTSGSAGDPLPGALGQPGTAILFGGGNVDNYNRSGARFIAGYWFDDEQDFGVEGTYFFLASRSVKVDLRSSALPGSLILGRPFLNVATGMQDVGIIALPGLTSGTVEVLSTSRLQGAEFNVAAKLPLGCAFHLTGLAGFRYLQLDENINVADNEMVSPNTVLIGGDAISVIDKFDAHNRFYGGQVGARGDYHSGRWSFEVLSKLAVGGMRESVRILSETAVTSAAGLTVFPAGFLALPSNSGRFSRDDFAVVPEAGATVGYQITDHLRATFGYTFLYISSVTRPGDSIDLALNPNQIPLSLTAGPLIGPVRPIARVQDTEFWAQGLNFGLEFSY
ncbi:MAG: BBP7 family outer membrane beta-barrel protein [Gemmataceae bacterium]